MSILSVSYTHLDVYKRQVVDSTGLEQITNFEYLGYNVSYITINDMGE